MTHMCMDFSSSLRKWKDIWGEGDEGESMSRKKAVRA